VRRPLALTLGDPAGIGPELALRAWQALHDEPQAPAFCFLGDADLLAERAALLGLTVPLHRLDDLAALDQISLDFAAIFAQALPVLHSPLPAPSLPGQLEPANAPAVLASIDQAVALTQAGTCRALVTNPINKAALYAAGFRFPGHTEYLGHLAGLDHPTVMMLACEALRVVPVTLHVSLSDAIKQLDAATLAHACRTTDAYLRDHMGIAQPRLAVSGLNPHAGEQGAMGREELDMIVPTLDALRAEGLDLRGPLPADTMFHERARQSYDAALCMTHDQALIPIKTLAFDEGVNLTMGLPFVRTSPDHGTALDIAGQGIARADSLIAALRFADRLATPASGYKALSDHPNQEAMP
jgi:4-hydroxythreonine-4-phosphate dehydrogenase